MLKFASRAQEHNPARLPKLSLISIRGRLRLGQGRLSLTGLIARV